jgi:hypothetical protein
MNDVPERSSLWSRLGWFAMLYVGGVLAAFMLAAAFHVLLSAKLLPATQGYQPHPGPKSQPPSQGPQAPQLHVESE